MCVCVGDPDLYVSCTDRMPQASAYSWHSWQIGSEKIVITPESPGYCEGWYYVGVTCDKTSACPSAFHINLHVQPVPARPTLAASGTLGNRDEIHWYSICLPTAAGTLNATLRSVDALSGGTQQGFPQMVLTRHKGATLKSIQDAGILVHVASTAPMLRSRSAALNLTQSTSQQVLSYRAPGKGPWYVGVFLPQGLALSLSLSLTLSPGYVGGGSSVFAHLNPFAVRHFAWLSAR
jgi:hypothetical protein